MDNGSRLLLVVVGGRYCWSRCGSLLWYLASVLMFVVIGQSMLRAEDTTLAKKALEVIAARKWVEVSPAEAVTIIEMLAIQTKGNYEQIQTWRGTCSVHSRRELSLRQSTEELQKYLKEPIKTPYVKDSRYVTDYMIDLAGNAACRRLQDARLTWIEKGSERAIEIPQTTLVTGNSVVTPAEFSRSL